MPTQKLSFKVCSLVVILFFHGALFIKLNKAEKTPKASVKIKIATSKSSVIDEDFSKAMPQSGNKPTSRPNKKAGVIEKPVLESDITPEYPYLSRVYKEEGEVSLLVKISPGGKVINAEIIKSSNFWRLDQSALEAVKKAPFSYQGTLPTETELSFEFKLEQ